LTLDAVESGIDVELAEIGALEDYPRILSGLAVMVSMRLHGLIIAHNVGTPAVGIAYDPKMRNATTGMGIESVDLSDDPATLASQIQATIAQDHLAPERVPGISLRQQFADLEPRTATPASVSPGRRRLETIRLAAGI
jgi:polysaccharide pyruvyl transferase WcaK-like protein